MQIDDAVFEVKEIVRTRHPAIQFPLYQLRMRSCCTLFGYDSLIGGLVWAHLVSNYAGHWAVL